MEDSEQGKIKASEVSNEEILSFLNAEIFEKGADVDVDSDIEETSELAEESELLNIDSGESSENLNIQLPASGNKKSAYKSRTRSKENLLQSLSRSSSNSSKNSKTDPRELYASRIVTVMNEVDFPAMLALITEICTPNVIMHVNRDSPQPHAEGKLFSTFMEGHVSVAKYLYGVMTFEPDSVLTLIESKFYSKSSEGMIVFKTEYRATKMYNIETTMDVLSPTLSNMSLSETTENTKESSSDSQQQESTPSMIEVAKSIIQEYDNIKNNLPIRKNPIPVLSQGINTLYTNKEKLISRVILIINMIENDLTLEE